MGAMGLDIPEGDDRLGLHLEHLHMDYPWMFSHTKVESISKGKFREIPVSSLMHPLWVSHIWGTWASHDVT